MNKLYSILLIGLIYGMASPSFGYDCVESPVSVEVSKCNENGAFFRSSSNKTSFDVSDDKEDMDPYERAYGVTYQNGVLTITWYNVCTSCSEKYNDVAIDAYGSNRYCFNLFYNYEDYDWNGPQADCLCIYNVSASYENFTPGRYVFILDYINYDVELQDGLDILLREKDASPEWVYSEENHTSGCRSVFDDPSEYYAQVTGDSSVRPNWGVKYENGKLSITWYDLIDNCAVYYQGASYKKDGDKMTFFLQQYFQTEYATCICRHDFTSIFENIESGDYKLIFGQKEFPLHLSEGTDILIADGHVLTEVESVPIEEGPFVISKNVLTVNTETGYECEIFNLEGIRMTSIQGNGQDEIYLGTLPKGIYIIRLTTDGRTVSARVQL